MAALLQLVIVRSSLLGASSSSLYQSINLIQCLLFKMHKVIEINVFLPRNIIKVKTNYQIVSNINYGLIYKKSIMLF